MNRSATARKNAWGLLALASAMGAACSGGEDASPWAAASAPAARAPHMEQPAATEARALVERLLQADRPALRPAPATSITPEGAFLRPELPALPKSALARRAEVWLPMRANGAFRLTEPASGMAIEVGLTGISDSPGEVADGFVVYRRGVGAAADVIHRPTVEGTEDYLHFEEPPAEEALGYDVILNENVAGLRLVSSTLEFLDAAGTPSLRMAPPWGIDARGQRFPARVSISGCAYDANPRAPWKRPTVAPGAHRCSVRVEWSGADLQYPVLIDPAWTTTGSLMTPRSFHTANLLADGKVLIAGGDPMPLPSVELYDPATGTFSATGDLLTARHYHTATTLMDGRVLVAGGVGGGVYIMSSELYDPATGMWNNVPFPFIGREFPTASLLPNGKVLLAGGANSMAPGGVLPGVYVFDPATNQWTSAIPMMTPRARHTASVLQSGKVLVVGGVSDSNMPTATAEVYDPATNQWTQTDSLAQARLVHTATVLQSGKVLITGGAMDGLATTSMNSVELYDPAVGMGTFTSAAALPVPLAHHRASILRSGKVLVTAGRSTAPLANTELYDPDLDMWSDAGNLIGGARVVHTATELDDGTVLVAGGQANNIFTAGAELFLLFQGDPCQKAQNCATGSCADGICCDTVCNGQCETCDGSIAGSTPGTCARATGAPPANRPSCQGTGATCGGTCGGTGPECIYPDLTTQCASTCENGSQSASTCDGKGNCKPFPTPIPCGAYACDGMTACKTDCATAADCAPGFQCNAENACVLVPVTCTDDHTLQDETGSLTDCTPFVCKGNLCLETCTSADDCTAPHICDATSKQCITPGAGGANDAAGCACTTGGPAGDPPWHWLAAIALATRIARRTSRRTHVAPPGGRRPL